MTGWNSEPPDAERPALPLTERLLAGRARAPGDALEIAAARSRAADAREAREAAAAAVDPDERAAGLVNRGYMPGQSFELSQRYADVMAELADEEARIERGQRRQERIARDHAAGRITAFDISRMADVDEGDQAKVDRLRLLAGRLRGQMGDAQAAISQQQEQAADPLEAASRHAHQTFVEVTRQRMADAEAGRSPGPRPFAGRGRDAVRSEQPVTCPHCIKYGATPEQSFLIHQDPSPLKPPATVSEAEQDWLSDQEAGRGEVIDRYPRRYDTLGREITRAAGYSPTGAYGNHNPMAVR